MRLRCRQMISSILLTLMLYVSANAAIITQNGSTGITVLEVIDYNCGYCKESYPNIETLKQLYPKVTFKIQPAAILRQSSIPKAAFAYALAMSHPELFGQYNFAVLISSESPEAFLQSHVDQHELKHITDMAHSTQVFNQIESGRNLLSTYQSGTPLLVISRDGAKEPVRVFRGLASLDQLKRGIEDALR